jgi:hypothetical protein
MARVPAYRGEPVMKKTTEAKLIYVCDQHLGTEATDMDIENFIKFANWYAERAPHIRDVEFAKGDAFKCHKQALELEEDEELDDIYNEIFEAWCSIKPEEIVCEGKYIGDIDGRHIYEFFGMYASCDHGGINPSFEDPDYVAANLTSIRRTT